MFEAQASVGFQARLRVTLRSDCHAEAKRTDECMRIAHVLDFSPEALTHLRSWRGLIGILQHALGSLDVHL